MILKSEIYNFHRLDLARQAGFIVSVYDEDGLAITNPCATPTEAFAEARKIVDNATIPLLFQQFPITTGSSMQHERDMDLLFGTAPL